MYVRLRWLAKLVARLLATATLWVRIQTSLKKYKNGRQKPRSGQHILANRKHIKKTDKHNHF